MTASFPAKMRRKEIVIISGISAFVLVLFSISSGVFDRAQLFVTGKQAMAKVESVSIVRNNGRKYFTYYVTVDGSNGRVESTRTTINYLGDEAETVDFAQPKNLRIPVVADGAKVIVGSKQELRASMWTLVGVGLPVLVLFGLVIRTAWMQAVPTGQPSSKTTSSRQPVKLNRRR